MKLLEICEPVFLYVCVLNRAAKSNAKSADYEYQNVRAALEKLFAEMLPKAGADVSLQGQVRQIELPLMFFVDSCISQSRLDFAPQWNSNRLAFKRNEYAGDQKFFKLLDSTLQAHTLKEGGAEAAERLEVFYVCLGLGFRGVYADKPLQLRQYIDDIGRLVSPSMERSWDKEITKEQFADATNLVQPPSQQLIIIGIVFLCLILATVITYIWTFREAAHSLSNSLYWILHHGGH
jgi:type VI protein secretion system component VasF